MQKQQAPIMILKILASVLLILISNQVLLFTSANQQQYERPSTTSTQTRFTPPYLILMSKNEISIAQLPLIDDGTVSVVYNLNNSQAIEFEDESKDESAIKEEELSSFSFPLPSSSRMPVADAREYEQMPQSQIQQTTTSLGKSEWQQQIATKSNNNKSISDENTRSVGTVEQEVVGSGNSNAGRANGRRREDDDGLVDSNVERKEVNSPRRRRSNSLVDRTDDDDDGNAIVADIAAVGAPAPEPASRLRLLHRGDVTSARFARGTTVNREEVEKKKPGGGYSNTAGGPSPEDDKNSALQFSDFDVHMALGYVFAADSTGRIHKFRLSGFESVAPTNPDGYLISNSLAKENDHSNTIDMAKMKLGSPTTFFTVQNSYSSRDDRKNEVLTNNVNDVDDDDANKVPQDKANNVTHEQSGRHPTSLGPGSLSVLVNNEALDSVALNTERTFNVNQEQQQQPKSLASSKPRIIWSRTRHGLLEMPLKAEQQLTASAEQKSTEGAFPLLNASVRPDNQMANETKHMGSATANEITTTEEEVQQLSGGKSGAGFDQHESAFIPEPTDAGQSLTSQLASGKKKPGTHLQTEIAVDWLNNLLFVLDKYRLFVVDFEGNNELVLIDDFNHNNRPIDIKVDPVSNFLFWLQVGNFHNTIYKLDLGVLSTQSASGKLLANGSKLANNNDIGKLATNLDVNSEFVALISHHYAHPIITNLPQHATLFTIDQKHSRIYVPLSSKNKHNDVDSGCNKSNATETGEDAEIFGSSEEMPTHMNSTLNNDLSETRNCTFEYGTSRHNNDQILAYNLDGTDVGPLRSAEEKSHLTGLNDLADITMDTDNGYLYWLTSDGRELYEEYKSDPSTFQPATHFLDGKKYNKLTFFGSNQPRNLKSRINLRKFILLQSTTTSTNRQVRSDGLEQLENGRMAYSLNNRRDANGNVDLGNLGRSTPYIVSAITCLVVLAIYLVYSFIFQPQRRISNNPDLRDGSISGLSSMSGSQIDYDITTNGFMDTSTIPKLVVNPSTRTNDSSPQINVIQSMPDFTGNTINHRYGGMGITKLSKFPSNINYMQNEHYVPIEVLGNEALSNIRRFSIEQLRIDDQCIGRGNFAEVKLGKITCTRNEETCPLHGSKIQQTTRVSVQTETSTYSTSAFDDLHHRVPVRTSIGTSSGHGSSSTSSDFMACTVNLEVGSGDYLTPKSQCNSSMSDYTVENQTFSRPDSYSSYYNSSVPPSTIINNHLDRFKNVSCSEANENEKKVAIKTLKLNATEDEKMDFLNEAVKLANLNHPNIVELIGICFDAGHKMIVMELMLEGDLIRYMQTNPDNLTEDDLFNICLDIVNGCCCLEREGVVHRDLAARNCLVSRREKGERVVKLADFGLARDIHKDSHYKKQSDSPMPLKWMAPESLSLSQRKFTTKSDVWSFGVVMWEVMNKCNEKPFAYEDPGSMLKILESGHRLGRPENCCEELYKLMTDCWQLEESRRPTFQECRAELIEIKNSRTH